MVKLFKNPIYIVIFQCIFMFLNPDNDPRRKMLSTFIYKYQSQRHRVQMTYRRSHSLLVTELGLETSSPDSPSSATQ